MHNKFFKTMAMGAIVMLLGIACSNKTKQANNTQNNPPSQQDRQRPPAQGERPPQQGQGQGMPSFDEMLAKMDANKDGKLAKTEVDGPLKNDFAKIDKNGDGFISAEEFKNAPPPPRGGN